MRTKIIWAWIVLMGVLSGCSPEPVYETIADSWEETAPAANPGRMEVPLPEGAEMEVMDAFGDGYYRVGSWELWTKVLSGGDVYKSLQTLSALNTQTLTVLERNMGDLRCYETTWAVTSEEGGQVVRAGILDDGNYHYCICLSAPEEEAGEAGPVFAEVFRAVRITNTDP